MKITCPTCATSYALRDNAIGADGRDVRCARCGMTWYVQTADEVGIDVDSAIAAIDDASFEITNTADNADATYDADTEPDGLDEDVGDDWASMIDDGETNFEAAIDVEDTQDGPEAASIIDSTPQDIESIARKRGSQLRRHRRKATRTVYVLAVKALRLRRFAGVAIFIFALTVLSASIVKRDLVVRVLPDLGGLYQKVGLDVNLRGLEFRDVTTFRDFNDGDVILIVEGQIANVSNSGQNIPKIRFALRSIQGEEIYAWALDPDKATLAPGQSLRFKSQYTSPPTRARRVQVRFTDSSIGKTASR